MYEARAICNYLLSERTPSRFYLSNMRINKLLYFIQGWSLNHEPHGLIRNHFEAWPYGPVVSHIYKEFSVFGENEITSFAKYLDYASGEIRDVDFARIAPNHRKLIARISDHYAQYSTAELVSQSHDPSGPWAFQWATRPAGSNTGGRIPNDTIKAHFVSKGWGKLRQ